MHRLKMVGLAAIGTTALLGIPSGPAVAGGPLLFVPWALGHLLTLPLVIAATAASAASSYSYGAPAYPAPPSYGPNYYGPSYYGPSYGSGYAAPPGSYAPPASYYAPGPGYYGAPPSYYGYARRPYVRYYGPRGYDAAPRLRYSGPHGAQGWHGGGGYYRRW
jgi:hypothetical protein